MNDEATKLREAFRLDATSLANRGLIDPAALLTFTGLVGYKNVAFELVGFANLMRGAWTTIQGKTPFTSDDIESAKALGVKLMLAAVHREQAPAFIAATARIRQQSITLLLRTSTPAAAGESR